MISADRDARERPLARRERTHPYLLGGAYPVCCTQILEQEPCGRACGSKGGQVGQECHREVSWGGI